MRAFSSVLPALFGAVLAVAAPALLSGCVTVDGQKATAAVQARDYYPSSAEGAVWRYQLTPSKNDERLEVLVERRDQQGFYVDNQGGRVAPRTDGLFDGTRFLLADPVVSGHTWSAKPKGQPVEHYEIVGVAHTAKVVAGTFDDCVTVKGTMPTKDPGTGAEGTLIVQWIWARNVGLIRVEQLVQFGSGAPVSTGVMELEAFTPGGDHG